MKVLKPNPTIHLCSLPVSSKIEVESPGKEAWARVDDIGEVVVLLTPVLPPQTAAEFEHRQPEDDGDDQQWGDDQEGEDLEPDVEEEDDGVDEQAESKEDVDEVEAQPRQEKMMATDQLDAKIISISS